MGSLTKRPEACLHYHIERRKAFCAALPPDIWRIEPDEPGGLHLCESGRDGALFSAAFTGGRAGQSYQVSNILLDDEEDSRSVIIKVEAELAGRRMTFEAMVREVGTTLASVAAQGRDDLKSYLRISHAAEDALLDQLLATVVEIAERHLACTLIIREFQEIRSAGSGWQRLGRTPVVAITQIEGLPADGAAFLLPVTSYRLDIDAAGDGWVEIIQSGAAGRVRVAYQAGLVSGWALLPAAIRQGIIRLAAHFYTHRDSADDAGPPAAVAALWQPWRRMRLR